MPLAGKRVVITRPETQTSQLIGSLREAGAIPILFPTIAIEPVADNGALDQALANLPAYDWVIFTSANGVHYFWQRLEERSNHFRVPSSLKVCAIGPATANELRKKGVRVDYIPKEYIAEAILDGFGRMTLQGSQILLARAKIARDVLPRGLRKMGAKVDVVEVYRTIKPKGGTRRLRQLLADEKIDLITFTSSSTVNHFVELLKKEYLKSALKGIVIACIGPVTSRTAKAWGMRVQIQPKAYTSPALTRVIAEYFTAPHLSPLPRETVSQYEKADSCSRGRGGRVEKI